MTNKSTSKKFFVGSVSALLVASAIVPVVSAVSFTDVSANNSHEPAIDALSDLNIISGFQDGTFKPSKTLTRSDVVKIMGKWLVSIGNTVPTDYKTNLRFTDFTVNTNDELLQYGALVKDLGVFNGYQDGSLGAAGTINRESMAIVLIRAYDQVYSTDLVTYVGTQTFTRDVVDLNLAKNEAKPFIDVLDFYDITNPLAPNYRPKETTTRAQFASLLYKALQTDTSMGVVTSLEGTTTMVNAMTANQFLAVKANNMTVAVSDLVADGYTVEFQSTNATAIANTATGELAPNLVNGTTFDYKVILVKGADTIESDLVTVTVRDYSTYISEITEYTLVQGLTTVESGKIAIANGNATIQATKGITIDGTTIPNPPVTYKSSSASIASVSLNTGTIIPNIAGTTNITMKVDGAERVVPVNVAAALRVAHSVETSLANVKLFLSKSKVIDVLVKDQYGDLFQLPVTAASNDAAIATATISPIVNGAGTLTIASAGVGETTVDISNGTDVLKSINTKVSNDSVITNHKIETVQTSDDFTLDIIKGSTDNLVNLHWNTYNANDYLIGNNLLTSPPYTVSSSNLAVATVAVVGGVITVTGVAPGTTNIVITEGQVPRETKTITVVDTTPKITNVSFEDVDPITNGGVFSERVLKASGITLSSTSFTPLIDSTLNVGYIYIELDGTLGYASGDILLGTINSSFSGDTTKITGLGITGGASVDGTVLTGADGPIVITVTRENEVESYAVKEIPVKFP